MQKNQKGAAACCGLGCVGLFLLFLMGVIGAALGPAPAPQPSAPSALAPTTSPASPPASPGALPRATDSASAGEGQASAKPSSAPAAPTGTPSAGPAPAPASGSPVPARPTPGAPSPSPTQKTAPPAPAGTSLAQLNTLEVKGRAPKTGYERDSFNWRDDVDHNGCDTRNDVLRRDLSSLVIKSGTNGCVVLTGVLHSPYSGSAVSFDRAHNTVDIDHVVALSDAWQTGAFRWDDATKRNFANDSLNLLAVEMSLNRQKGDSDAASWLPPNKGVRCDYVARQIAVKSKYHLWVKPAEKDAMARVLASCPSQPAYGTATAWPAPNASSPSAPQHLVDAPAQPRPEEKPAKKPEKKPEPEREKRLREEPQKQPATGKSVHPGSFCANRGDTGYTKKGKLKVCEKGSDGRLRWQSP